ncbi:uncharacterized protein LOC117470689 isoform X2 [Trematomus bernacchii]|uniref:uncharacterized protein LOC117470689 isoform X2 n=1 Tax=Trematomus bernacchii TaxID=40690 RepID=UPI00146B4F60|nr:uncharacterized protein LOC117470689 isoform X2 [Trematomus bernacchii]
MMKTMIQAVLLVNIFSSQLLMLHSAVHSLSASCRDDVSLTCPDVGSDFVSVTWYKRIDQDKCGILRWSSKDKSKPEFFKSNRSVHYDYDQDYSLLISAVTPVDSGTYECEVGARVGYQNTKVEVKLDVSACVTPAVPTPVTPVTPAVRTPVTPVPNTTFDHCRLQVQELPVLWSAVVYGTVGLAKIVLSIIIVLIIRCVQTKSSKRRQQKW